MINNFFHKFYKNINILMSLSKIWNNKNRLWLVKENKKYIMIYKKDKIKY